MDLLGPIISLSLTRECKHDSVRRIVAEIGILNWSAVIKEQAFSDQLLGVHYRALGCYFCPFSFLGELGRRGWMMFVL